MGDHGFKTYETIVEHIESFRKEASDFYKKGNKSAGMRARKALDKIAKLKVGWRKEMLHG